MGINFAVRFVPALALMSQTATASLPSDLCISLWCWHSHLCD